jgi:hypothetical protein
MSAPSAGVRAPGLPISNKSASFTAVINNFYQCSATLTATLPTSPGTGGEVGFVVTTGTTTITAGGTDKISQGGNSTLTSVTALVGTVVRLQYLSGVWYIVNDSRALAALQAANNLSDVASASTALTNLGALAKANNLSDVNSAATARTNLGFHYGSATLTWPGAASTSNIVTVSHGVGAIPTAVFLNALDATFNVTMELAAASTSTQFSMQGTSVAGGNPASSHTSTVYWLALP